MIFTLLLRPIPAVLTIPSEKVIDAMEVHTSKKINLDTPKFFSQTDCAFLSRKMIPEDHATMEEM